MRIDMPPRKPRPETIIPMINVVFLLLIFFLLTAQIAPSLPFPLTPPDGQAEAQADGRDVLYISAKGELAWNETRDEAVWPAIAAHAGQDPVEIRADASLSAAVLAIHLRRLQAIRDSGATLVIGRSGG